MLLKATKESSKWTFCAKQVLFLSLHESPVCSHLLTTAYCYEHLLITECNPDEYNNLFIYSAFVYIMKIIIYKCLITSITLTVRF